MTVNNLSILVDAWVNGSSDYQARIPQPTQDNIQDTINRLSAPGNSQLRNEFVDGLFNRLVGESIRVRRWSNRLAPFKNNNTAFSAGNAVREMIVPWYDAHSYNGNVSTLLDATKTEKIGNAFHFINRQDQYTRDVMWNELVKGFTTPNGANSYLSAKATALLNSDEYDEYCIMRELITQACDNGDNYNISLAKPSDNATGKAFIKSLQEYNEYIQFPSSMWAKGIHRVCPDLEEVPTFALPDEMILITTPSVKANLNVETLATLFNVEYATLNEHMVIVDSINAVDEDGHEIYAILTTRDWFMCADSLRDTESFYDPSRRVNRIFLNHWGMYSYSPFVPFISWSHTA